MTITDRDERMRYVRNHPEATVEDLCEALGTDHHQVYRLKKACGVLREKRTPLRREVSHYALLTAARKVRDGQATWGDYSELWGYAINTIRKTALETLARYEETDEQGRTRYDRLRRNLLTLPMSQWKKRLEDEP